jgi:porphobilinogen synthase
MVRETPLLSRKMILPLFLKEGAGLQIPHPQLPTVYTWSLDKLIPYLRTLNAHQLGGVLLFGVSDKRDPNGSEALRKDNIVLQAIKEIRSTCPDLIVATDIALDPYTDHGHDGLFENGKILNDQSVQVLCEMSYLHAEAGAHIVAPSDMMDGRVLEIRESLDEGNFQDTLVLAYTAKYASCLYGPFRDILKSEVQGDKKTYQMDPANRREAMRELELDLSEGADLVMVKPAGQYLDIIADFSQVSSVPVAAYQVSGECAMIELGAKAGLFDRDRAIAESLTSIFRAGADLIVSYFAAEAPALFEKYTKE